jgi:hypothetical protein
MLKNLNDVLGFVLMNAYVKVPTLSVLRICFNRYKHHNITQRRYRHNQVQGRQCLLHLLNREQSTGMTKYSVYQ